VLDPGRGQVVLTAYFDTETFLVNNVRAYRVAAVRQGDRILRIDPDLWRPPAGRLSFSDPLVVEFLDGGWSNVEAWGTWALGNSSRLRISLTAGTEHRMVINASPYCPTPRSRQSMQVMWNATPLADFVFEGCVPQTFEVVIPGNLVSGNLDVVTFHYGYSTAPFEATGGIHGDRCQLAVGFESIQFEPQ
jgi:hypothetical protein